MAIYAAVGLIFLSFVLMVFSLGFEKLLGKKQYREDAARGPQAIPTYDVSALGFAMLNTVTTTDGVTMNLIPAGIFLRGSKPGDGDLDEMPQSAVFVSAFYIDQYEVTTGQYTDFIKATKFSTPFIPFFEDDISKITDPAQPVVGVSWDAAVAYCKWVGKRLPTEAEWEKAARWEDGRIWPWGNEDQFARANLSGADDGYPYTAPPGAMKAGRSPYGPYDMAGNVSEWVADWYVEDYYSQAPQKDPMGPEQTRNKVFRGGSWNDSSASARAAKRYAAVPHRTDAIIGFRCAMNVEDLERNT
jgi:formylglycine-generating enzyme